MKMCSDMLHLVTYCMLAASNEQRFRYVYLYRSIASRVYYKQRPPKRETCGAASSAKTVASSHKTDAKTPGY
jgi:hypothetical protein